MRKPSRVSLWAPLVGLAIALLAAAASAKDDRKFGPAVDAFCTANGRDPATPFADGRSATPQTECQLCHQPFTFDKRHVTQGFNEYKSAIQIANNTGTQPDFSYFCPASTTVNQPPVLAPIGNRTLQEAELLAFLLSATDPEGDALWFDAANLPTGATLTDHGNGTADFSWTPSFDQAGNHDVTFLVTDDGSPMESDSEKITITVGDVNRPPTLDPIGNRTASEGTQLAFAISASDPDGDALWFDGANLPAGATLTDLGDGTADFSWTPAFGQAGNFPVSFVVTDDGAPMESDSEQITITVGNVNRPPTLDPIGDRMGKVSVPMTIALTASDPDGDALAFGATALPPGAELVDYGDGSAELLWTPMSGQDGNHAVTCSVTDAGSPTESDSEQFTISVAPVDLPPANRPPTLDPVGNRTVTEGQPLAIVLTASDPDGDGLAFAVDGLPASAGFTDYGDGSAEVSWTPGPNDVGDHMLTCRVSDDGSPSESDAEAIRVRVESAAPPPPADPSFYLELGRAKWRADKSRLFVRGRTRPFTTLEILGASGQVIATTRTRNTGKFQLWTRPVMAPCEVQARVGEAYSDMIPVENAPPECGQPGVTYFQVKKVQWYCSKSRLLVYGLQAPDHSTMVIRDADSGQVVGTTSASRTGKFVYWSSLGTAPSNVQVGVEVDGSVWFEDSVRPVARMGCGS